MASGEDHTREAKKIAEHVQATQVDSTQGTIAVDAETAGAPQSPSVLELAVASREPPRGSSRSGDKRGSRARFLSDTPPDAAMHT